MPRLSLPSVMSSPAGFDELRAHGERTLALEIPRLLQAEPDRAIELSLRIGPLYANFARQRYDAQALHALFALADAVDFPACLQALFDGAEVNLSEARPALHTSLRSALSEAAVARQAHAAALEARQRMRELVGRVHADGITDVVSVGIGGSDLGPRLVVDALATTVSGLPQVHFVSNVDPAAAARAIAGLDPARTAVVLISKSFGTQETLLNGRILRQWLGDDSRLYAVTANLPAAAGFGIPGERTLPMWDWVGGRYSLWSAVGFPIALALGMEAFEAMLGGAAEMDAHVLHSPARENLAAWHALTAVWNRNALGLPTQSVQPYAEALRLLPAYLQQLVMESLGKRVRSDGSPVVADTVPVWWGGVGTDTQHSYFQALHQGTQLVPMDFIGVASTGAGHAANSRSLLANLLAQAESLANGEVHDQPHRVYPGGRPSTMVLLDELSPRSLGALLAMYEHSVFLQAMVWGINPFDQFGVELGKQVAARVLPALEGEGGVEDPVTRELLRQLSAAR